MVKVNEEMIEIGEDERFIPNLIEWVEAINTFARNEVKGELSHFLSSSLCFTHLLLFPFPHVS